MLKKLKWFTILAMVGIVFSLVGCKQYVPVPIVDDNSDGIQIDDDGIAPSDVSDLLVNVTNNSVIFTWTDPIESNLFGIEISWIEQNAGRKITPLPENSILILPSVQFAEISNFDLDSQYSVTIKTVDTAGNKSDGITKTVDPTLISADKITEPLTITLSTTPELSNTTKTITVDIDTEVPVLKVVYERGGSAVPKTLLESTTAKPAVKQSNSKWTFDVEDNGTYAVAVLDAEGRREREEITVQSFDKTPPTNVSNYTGVISGNDINLSWTNPTPSGSYDSPLSKILISYKKDTETIFSTPQAIAKGIQSYTISDFDSSVSYYDINIQVVDELGNSRSSKARVYVDVSKRLQVGDVILKNGTVLKYEEATPADYTNNSSEAVAIICSYVNGVPYGVGVNQSASFLEWAPEDTTGYNTDFEGIKCNYTNFYSGGSYTQTFTGVTDGSDNWNYICSIDPIGTTNPATNYPAFNFALNYAENNSLTGDYATGWYLPSIAELYGVYENRIIVNEVLDYLGESQISSWYWSSSQSPSDYNNALLLAFSVGYVDNSYKFSNNYVLVIRAF